MTPRLLTPGDIPSAVELSDAAGWNQTADDWMRLITVEPEGCFGLDRNGKLIATTTVLRHERSVAWIGMVLTHKDYQRRGYARQLLWAAIEFASSRGIGCVALDATDQGRPLYSSLAFQDEQPIERWRRERSPLNAEPDRSIMPGAPPFALDAQAFGASRERFLASLAAKQPAYCIDRGYVMDRPGAQTRYLGPCVASNAATARRLITHALAARPHEAWFWDLLPNNWEAVALARALGFTPVRRLTRMTRGERRRGNEAMVFATAGFEAG